MNTGGQEIMDVEAVLKELRTLADTGPQMYLGTLVRAIKCIEALSKPNVTYH